MRFLIDAQLPPSLASVLRNQGHEAFHVFERLPSDARDSSIWGLSVREGFVLVTKDEDFAEWSRLRDPVPPVLWLRLGNLRNSALRAQLEPLLPELVRRLKRGETLIEVR